MNEQCEGYNAPCDNTYTQCVDNDDKTSPFKYVYYCDICAGIRDRSRKLRHETNNSIDIEIVV